MILFRREKYCHLLRGNSVCNKLSHMHKSSIGENAKMNEDTPNYTLTLMG